jgi:hypothetical protein
MNIFYLDHDPLKAAQYHNDKHVVKMITETAQILCTALRKKNYIEDWMYRITHQNHPSVLWVEKSWNNFAWTCELGLALSKEYSFRYNKIHKSEAILDKCVELLFDNHQFDVTNLTKPALAMPEEYHSDDPVKAYRDYYVGDKQFWSRTNKSTGETKHIPFTWTKRNKPYWWVDKKI